jgi:hypothetical protein
MLLAFDSCFCFCLDNGLSSTAMIQYSEDIGEKLMKML